MSAYNKKCIDIVGPSYNNKGDYMMGLVIQQMLEPKYQLAIEGRSEAPYLYRRLTGGLGRRMPPGLKVRLWKYHAARFMPENMRRKFEYMRYDEIFAVLDCSGFQYGDQWTNLMPKHVWRIDHYRKVKSMGKKVVMLPQAFGPFEKPEVRKTMLDILENVDIVHARDTMSRDYLAGLGLGPEKLRLCADFTNILEGTPPADPGEWSDKVCIIPNSRMLDMTDAETSKKYKEFILTLIRASKEKGFQAIIVLHDKYDHLLGAELVEMAGGGVPVIEEHPKIVKGILANCRAVASSRYHGLMSALSQAVPTIGTGWTHKYKGMFQDYGCPECLVEDISSDELTREKLNLVIEDGTRDRLISVLQESSGRLKQKSRDMWRDVIEYLEA